MPIYCYECSMCQAVFDVNASFKSKEDGLTPECPKCHGRKVRQLITGGLFLRSKEGVDFAGPACDPDNNPGCCG